MKSVFTDKTHEPTEADLKQALGNTFELWQELAAFTKKTNPDVFEEWKMTSEKFGWGFRINDKKRVIVYLLPRAGFFKVAFVFGQKAMDEICASTISATIVNELKAAKVYAEGRGIRIEVKDSTVMDDLKRLIEVKVGN